MVNEIIKLWSGHVLHSGKSDRESMRVLDRDTRIFLFKLAACITLD